MPSRPVPNLPRNPPEARADGAPGVNGARAEVSLLGTGSYTPQRVLTNGEMERMVDTSDEWITARTGIRERRIAAEGEQTSDMAAEAARAALAQAGVEASELGLLLVATASPDMLFPATACLVQRKIGAQRAACMDISAACSGFLYALELARQMIGGGGVRYALVIGAEKLSAFINWNDRNTCVLFGDGAGAVVLGPRTPDRIGRGILTTYMGSDGEYSDILSLPGGGSRCPISAANVGEKLNTLHMLGKETFKQAVTAMTGASLEVLNRTGLAADDIACIIPHQANVRIIEAIADRLKLPMDRFFLNLARDGNTGAAAVAIALDEAHRAGRIQPGDRVLMIVFGSGLTWASSIVEW
jgi:3-oxoacyl-[acyl-carrier-protein] synthase-3